MSSILRAILMVVVSLVWIPNASAWQPVGNFFRARNLRETSIMDIGLDKDNRPVWDGVWPTEFRRLSPEDDPTLKKGLLVVRIKGEERFLAFPVDASGSNDVRLVTEKGPGCFWTKKRFQQEEKVIREEIGGDGRRIRVKQVTWEYLFWPSEGPLMGQVLCGDEDKLLVLRASPTKRRFGHVKEFLYDDDPNDGK